MRRGTGISLAGSRIIRRVAAKKFRRIGIPTLRHFAALRGDRWRGVVVSTWSWAGDELGRERRESARTYATSIEATAVAERMQRRMERPDPDELSTARITARIRKASGLERRRRGQNRVWASTGNIDLNYLKVAR